MAAEEMAKDSNEGEDYDQIASSWKESHTLQEGDDVAVHTAFQSNDKTPVAISRYSKGHVDIVDDDGDANINFEGLGKRWVKKRNFPNLAKLFKVGDRVIVQKTFMSNSKNSDVKLAKGDRGVIVSLDKDSDAVINFE